MHWFSLEGKQTAITIAATIVGVLIGFTIAIRFSSWSGLTIALLLSLLPALLLSRTFTRPLVRQIRALIDSTQNFKDKDFCVTVASNRNDELGDLVASHNEVAELLRAERADLYQRELLLETVFESIPFLMILTDDRDRVIYSNNEARKILTAGNRFEGQLLSDVLTALHSNIATASMQGTNGIITVDNQDISQSYYLESRHFWLNNRRHTLRQIREMTRELGRQEVATWKKVIRVISHELNNSLAPISSLAHSGQLALRSNETQTLDQILNTIADRSTHLKSFIESYVQFARLPRPNRTSVDLRPMLEHIRLQYSVNVTETGLHNPVNVDLAQFEQVLINIVKNGLEASSSEMVVLNIDHKPDALEITVQDQGPGMSEHVLQNALLPFYSTKHNGTGLGLALCREIVEAHDGRIAVKNGPESGAIVAITIPMRSAPPTR